MTGGGALVEMLRRHHVDTIFALPGVQNDALFVALYDAGEALRVIHTRHEQGAAYMAFGYARASGKVMFSFHTFIVKTGKHTILIDSCLGNDKERPTRPQFHRMRTPYLADLARVGVRPEDVDYVMCTHLHWDHVGWNTRLENGRWVPTFPNARYVMARRQFSQWQEVHQNGEDTPHRRAFEDSVPPVGRTGQSVLADDD